MQGDLVHEECRGAFIHVTSLSVTLVPLFKHRVIGNHRRVLWRQILLFVNAEHSQEFIFMQCISRNHLLREFRVRAHSWPWRCINYTCSHVTWFSLCKQTALLIKKKTALPWGKTQITFSSLLLSVDWIDFITSFCLTTQGSLFVLLTGGITAVISVCLPNPLHAIYHFFPPIVSGNIWNLTVVKHKIGGIRRFNSDWFWRHQMSLKRTKQT